MNNIYLYAEKNIFKLDLSFENRFELAFKFTKK